MLASLSFAPLLPLPVLLVLAGLGLLVLAPGLIRRQRGAVLRALALLVLMALLADPQLRLEEREDVATVVALVVDESASQTLGNRAAVTAAARAALVARLPEIGNIDLRIIEASDTTEDGTRLFEALSRGLETVPPERLGAVIALSDGLAHDVPETLDALGIAAPFHLLLTGRADEFDRRIAVTEAPRFSLVDQAQTIAYQVLAEGSGGPDRPAEVVVRRDGEEIDRRLATPGTTVRLPVTVTHAGETLVEIALQPAEGELSDVNNRAVIRIEGIRETLRVLLVSGEPHAGERVWRNLLTSDAAVDLVHFTILRPPDKQDGTPINELSLIAFPTRELFVDQISGFDLIIFDRYQMRNVLPPIYFQNIARYVEEGGALLVAAGPEYAGEASIARSALAEILPARPSGTWSEAGFVPRVTETGARHPVTARLPGAGGTVPAWSRWFRAIDAQIWSNDAVPALADERGAPILLLDHVGRGRVALMLSDQVWLWARNFEGGGPHLPLLRRLAHWLMGEPELAEERLTARTLGEALVIERNSLAEEAGPVTVTDPSGQSRSIALQGGEGGRFTARIPADRLGLWTVTDGALTALAHVGPLDPTEYRDVVSTPERLAPLAEVDGSVRRIGDDANAPLLPRLAMIGRSGPAAGADWIGIRRTGASVLTDVRALPLASGLAVLAVCLALLAGLWWREGR
ncbi:MAG: hypothetical protein KDI98_04455 [Hyphomicrobiaceae bacterium]|nr:hypothetical protein [Hyphomicrobiaceae bacterium]